MSGDVILGYDGAASDEVPIAYSLRGGVLIAYSWGREREADPAVEVAELDRRAAISREEAARCGPFSTHPDREWAARRAAAAIRAAFGLAP